MAVTADRGGEICFTDFGDVVLLDVDPVSERIAVDGQGRLQRAVAPGKLERVQRVVHVFGSVDTDVIAVKRLADSAAQPIDAGQCQRAEDDRDREHRERAVANAVAE